MVDSKWRIFMCMCRLHPKKPSRLARPQRRTAPGPDAGVAGSAR
jgi:hypothetical protein